MKGFLLTLSVLLAFTRENNGEPNVVLRPRYPSVYVGDDVSLRCNGSSGPTIWKFNGKELSYKDSIILLTVVTPADDGDYKCKRNGVESDAFNLKVLELEPHAQLSMPPGGAVISRGDARVLTLQVDEELENWKCFAFRDNAGFVLNVMPVGTNVGRVYADFVNSHRASFWCKKTGSNQRSNVVTLIMTDRVVMLEPATPVLQEQALTLKCATWGGGKVEEAQFYKDNKTIKTTKSDTYIIHNPTEKDDGEYKCNATYRYSHISPKAAAKTIESDPQQIKVINGPPVASLEVNYDTQLTCSCAMCKPECTTYQWHHTDNLKTRKMLDQTDEIIQISEQGLYNCRAICDNGFSRFSNVHNYKGEPGGGGTVVVILVIFVIILLGLIFIVIAFVTKRSRRNEMQTTGRKKDDKDKSGGDYEQIGLSDKATYQTLGDATDQEKAEGGYEALKKIDEDKAVYHTLGDAIAPEKAEGGYEALKKIDEDKAVYHTLGAGEEQSQPQDQGGYEALKSVKAEVYQTLSSGSEKPEGESEGGYEQLPQKIGDVKDVTVEENPYEELKADKLKK